MPTRAEIVLDTISPVGCRIITMRLEYPRVIHAQMLRHTALRRTVMSSRAVPTARLIELAQTDPAIPSRWMRACRGMEAREDLPMDVAAKCRANWLAARDNAINTARAAHALGEQKQTANRHLEPYVHVAEIVTGTLDSWRSMLALRLPSDADPAVQHLAKLIELAIRHSTPNPSTVHAPMKRAGESPDPMLTAGRCARVSVARDTETEDIHTTLTRASKMLSDGHLTPFEHYAQAMSTDERIGPYTGWASYRSMLALDSSI